MKLFVTLLLVCSARAQNVDDYDDDMNHIDQLDKYEPTWESLGRRPLPQWFDDAKVGIFIHWGVYSFFGIDSSAEQGISGAEWIWHTWRKKKFTNHEDYVNEYMSPTISYQDTANMFTGEFFDPYDWAEKFKRFGAKYVVLTSKHHDGFALYPAKTSPSWNSVATGPHRDIVGELRTAVLEKGLEFGLYYSLMEFFNPLYLNEEKLLNTSNYFVQRKVTPDLMQIINDYQPSVLWSDGEWDQTDEYWNATNFIAWLYNESPVKDKIVVNDRWGAGTRGGYGDFYDFSDRFNPLILVKHKWENAFTIDKSSWGYRKSMTLNEIPSLTYLLMNVISTISCGGNVLINIGPTKEGTIPLIFEKRLTALGDFLRVNGEAIYATTPWKHQVDEDNGNVWYTCRSESRNREDIQRNPHVVKEIFAIFASWPTNNTLWLKSVTIELISGKYDVGLLGHNYSSLKWKVLGAYSKIHLPMLSTLTDPTIGWAVKFTKV